MRLALAGFDEQVRSREDRIDRLEEILTSNSFSRRAVAYLGELRLGTGEEDFCLPMVQYLLRGGEVNAFCYARSLDLSGKLPDDARAVAATTRILARRLGLWPGSVRFYAASGHVYV